MKFAAEYFIKAWIQPIRPARRRAYLIASVLMLIPFLSTIPLAIAFSHPSIKLHPKEVLLKALKAALLILLIFAPGAMVYFLYDLLLHKMGMTHLVLSMAAIVFILGFTFSAAVRLPMALCRICDGGSLTEALDGRLMKAAISAGFWPYLLSLGALLLMVFVSALLNYLPFWLMLLLGAFWSTYILFTVGTMFIGVYSDVKGQIGLKPAPVKKTPKAVGAFMLLFLLLLPRPAFGFLDYDNQPELPDDFVRQYDQAYDHYAHTGALNKDTYLHYDAATQRFVPRPIHIRSDIPAGQQFAMNVADVVTDLIPVVSNIKSFGQWAYFRRISQDESQDPRAREYARRMMWYKGVSFALGPLGKLTHYATPLNGGVVMHILGRSDPLVQTASNMIWHWDRIGNVGAFTGGFIQQIGPDGGLGKPIPGPTSLHQPQGRDPVYYEPLEGTYSGFMIPNQSTYSAMGMTAEIGDPEVTFTVDENGFLSVQYVVESSFEFSMMGAEMSGSGHTFVNIDRIPMDYGRRSYEVRFTTYVVSETQTSYSGPMYENGGVVDSQDRVKVDITVSLSHQNYGGELWPVISGTAVHTVEFEGDPEEQLQIGPASLTLRFEIPKT